MKSIRESRGWPWPTSWILIAVSVGLILTFLQAGQAADSLCATVKMEIRQGLTLERQAFDAQMRIHNGIAHLALEDVGVVVTFSDLDGNQLTATSDPDDSDALFYLRIDSMDNINDVSGSGRIEPSTSAEIHWLIVPASGAGGSSPSGVRYLVGARLSYRIGAEEHLMDVVPDSILVKPMPMLELDYFLPGEVFGDDAFTPSTEPPVPFSAGLRIRNAGSGVARDVRIDSAQPRIIENELGLLIGFRVIGSEVNGGAGQDTLLVDFGDISPAAAGVARWMMECTLSGRFVEFQAHYVHADELGGMLTSLVRDPINTHLLIHDVLVDLPGRDVIRDFLAKNDAEYNLYESDGGDTPVADRSSGALLDQTGGRGTRPSWTLTVPPTAGPLFVQKPIPSATELQVISARRSDGKHLPTENVWFSQTRIQNNPWEYYLNLFDVDGGGTYLLGIEDASGLPQAPVLAHIGDKVTLVGDSLGLGFLVEASDPNGTLPALTVTPLPEGAEFTTSQEGALARGTFFWRPQAGQEGVYPIRFTATDGELADSEVIRIYVGHQGEETGEEGIPGSLVDFASNAYVAPDGAHVWPYDKWDKAARDIASAMEACRDRSTIWVASGSYALAGPIEVTAGIHLRAVNGPSLTHLDAQGHSRCIRLAYPDALVHGFTISGGSAAQGGGVFLEEQGRIENCIVTDNEASEEGGGVYCANGGTIRNSVVFNNRAPVAGGVFCEAGGTVESCTITVNESTTHGGGLYCDAGGTIVNTIVYHNVAPADANVGDLGTGASYRSCCTTPLISAGEGNTDLDPDFRDLSAHDFWPRYGSPCIDTGTLQDWMGDSLDLSGAPRVLETAVDMGAYEYADLLHAENPLSPDGDVRVLRWQSVPGRDYTLYWSTNVLGPWAVLHQMTGQGGEVSYSHEYSLEGSTFYWLKVEQTFNTRPQIESVADRFVVVNESLLITNTVYDAEAPFQAFEFTLLDGPAGATLRSISARRALLRWTPACEQGSSTNFVRIKVSDNGNPPLSATNSYWLTVYECVELSLGRTNVLAGQQACIPLNLLSTVELTNLTFSVLYLPERLSDFTLEINPEVVSAPLLTDVAPGELRISFDLPADKVLRGPTNVATLCLTALPDQPSAFVPIEVANVDGQRPDGRKVANAYGLPGRVAVVGAEPLIESRLPNPSEALLLLYGQPGTTSILECADSLTPPIEWRECATITMDEMVLEVPMPEATGQSLFIRARRE